MRKAFALSLLATMFLLFIVPSISALAPPTCGVIITDSGTCTGGFSKVQCAALGGDCCLAAGMYCNLDGLTGECTNKGANPPEIQCSNFNDNEQGCNTFYCNWEPTAFGSACGGNSGPQGYGEICSSTSECASCLVCESGRCTQRDGVCTTIPEIYVAPPSSYNPPSSGNGLDPVSAITKLESGDTSGTDGKGAAVVGGSSNTYKVSLFTGYDAATGKPNWQVNGLIGVAIVCSIIALAAMFGTAFNLPTVKAFANNELKQAVISVLLIVSLVGLVTFFDLIAKQAIESMQLPNLCNPNEPCYISAAKYYLTTLEDTGNQYAKNQLNESIVLARRASWGYSINLNQVILLFYGMTIRFSAGDSLNAERHGAMFTQMSKILVSLSAQKYFIDVITFGIAPLFILLGIVLRTFFFTRKLGGLLLAIAIALFIVYPLTYAFAWYTLNVTVYGERTMASNSDPSCPSECTGTYPAAFFTNSNGELVQFPTVQSIVRAGINTNNFGSGGPAGEFSGLVSCRNLTSIGITENSCQDCPDYCRDVPFPGLPGCNITSCSACNAGCKIVRQRLTCQTDPICAGKCPLECRTRIPLENKCFSNESGGIIPADQSVSCAGCSKYPAWCRFLKNNTGVLEPVYTDDVCKDGTLDVSNDPSCPQQCSYVTSMGTATTCDTICSYTNKTTGETTSCPDICRVDELLNKPGWSSMYDIKPDPDLTTYCNETVGRGLACSQCAKHPECIISVPSPPSGCAGYPSNGLSGFCTNCPEYCRRLNFTNFFTNYSNVDRNSSTNVPTVCIPTNLNKMNCSSVGSPSACNETCKMNGALLICRTYNWDDPDPSLCRHCPELARFNITYNASGVCPGGASTAPPSEVSADLSAQEQAPGTMLPSGSNGFESTIQPSVPKPMEVSADLSAPKPAPGTMLLSGSNGFESTIRLFVPKIIYVAEVKITPIDPTNATPLQGYCTASIDEPVIILKGAEERLQRNSPHSSRGLSLEGELVNFNYTWYKDGVQWGGYQKSGSTPFETSLLVSTIPITDLSLGQEWVLWCQAYNDTAKSSWASSSPITSITMASLPNSAKIEPNQTDNSTPLLGYCNVSSSISPLTIDYIWYRNHTNVSNGSKSGIMANKSALISQVPTINLTIGDNWTFSCRGDNGVAKSAWLNSSDVLLKNKTIEMQSSNISPSPAYTNNTLIGSCMATNDPIYPVLSYEYIWYRNNSSVSSGRIGIFQQNISANVSSYAPVFSSYYGIKTLEANETWIFSCRAYFTAANGSVLYSKWLNSSVVAIQHLPPEPACTVTTVIPYSKQPANCTSCNGTCMGPTAYLPTTSNDPACTDAVTMHCPYGCRMRGNAAFMASLDPICRSGACNDSFRDFPQCFLNLTKDIKNKDNQSGPVCSEFIGYGNASCHSASCASRPISPETACTTENGASTGCEVMPNNLCDLDACTSITREADCSGACQWMNIYDKVIINARVDPGAPLTFFPDTSYQRRTACANCPEQCRVDSYASSCGVVDNTGTGPLDGYVDCSIDSCPYACRTPQPSINPPPADVPPAFNITNNPINPLCKVYDATFTSCLDCPALCRRSSNVLTDIPIDCPSTACQLSADPTRGCTDACLLPDPPEKMCDGCLDCDFECLYYPAVRSSCSEVCSDESLAGPVDIAPNDFIKSLPGAQTAFSDVKGIGQFFVPAVVLPLFCIVIVVSFVRGLSPLLGGDIEIPGLGRII